MRLRANIDRALSAGHGEAGDSSDLRERPHRAARRHSHSDEPALLTSGFISATGGGETGSGRGALSDSLSSHEEEISRALVRSGRHGSDTNPYAVSSVPLSLSLAPMPASAVATSEMAEPPAPVLRHSAPTAASHASGRPPARAHPAALLRPRGESTSSMEASDTEYNRIFERNSLSLEAQQSPQYSDSLTSRPGGISREFDVNLRAQSPRSALNAQNTAL